MKWIFGILFIIAIVWLIYYCNFEHFDYSKKDIPECQYKNDIVNIHNSIGPFNTIFHGGAKAIYISAELLKNEKDISKVNKRTNKIIDHLYFEDKKTKYQITHTNKLKASNGAIIYEITDPKVIESDGIFVYIPNESIPYIISIRMGSGALVNVRRTSCKPA